ncbi:MAG TPA: diguanylate cyclase [Steroidobacteraceae bacterium]|jgi:diguanylate cyclase (GGDEF)-like protein|nr:diguanylate cyclase [Steroidobacteraceae bacterium]
MRTLLAACLFGLLASLSATVLAAQPAFEVRRLDPALSSPGVEDVTHGRLDDHFLPASATRSLPRAGDYWLRLTLPEAFAPREVATINVRRGRNMDAELYVMDHGAPVSLRLASYVPGFLGAQDAIYILPAGLAAGQSVYVHAMSNSPGPTGMRFSTSTLPETLAAAADNARMIALSFGALMAMAVAALLIWFVLSDRLLILYATLFALQAVYVAYLSGQGFEWPILSLALPVIGYSWNIAAALSGAVACLFVREIAELQRFSPRVYKLFGWFAIAFVVLAFGNFTDVIGLDDIVVALGNLMFVVSAVTTLVVAFLAWRRDNRAAGWFLIAWGLLEAATIATALHLQFSRDSGESALLLYYVLPASMVAAAVLIALGVADRLRDQRLALTDAERRAQSDALTGVLNRRSLLERLDSACLRARARGLPIALLFIDLDHFKQINDTYGHPAGDACLKAIIGPIQSELRQSDVIGRYGGEEFVVILSSADAAAAQPIAERIRQRVAEISVPGFGASIHLTCSIGIATSDMLGVWGEHLIARADEAVYAAKRCGRNCVQIAAPTPVAA